MVLASKSSFISSGSPISLAEIVSLTEKNRLPISAYEELKLALADHEYVIQEARFHADVVEAMRRVPRSEVPDMPDRIVEAPVVDFGVLVISQQRQFWVRFI